MPSTTPPSLDPSPVPAVTQPSVQPAIAQRTRRLDILAGLLALLTLGLAVPLLILFPSSAPLADGWHTPIIAFELARTPADLAFLTGPGAQALRDAMDLGHRVDFFFTFFYSCLLFAVLLRHRGSSKKLATMGMFFALVAIPTDLYENRVLGHIVDALNQAVSTELLLPALFITTWIKWLSIGFSLLCVAVLNARDHKTVAALCALAAPASIAALLTANPIAGELMSVAVTLGFVAVAIQAMTRAKRLLKR